MLFLLQVNIADQDTFIDTLCNLTRFSDMFNFSVGGYSQVDIQETLCEAAINESLLIQDILKLVSVDALLKEVSSLL